MPDKVVLSRQFEALAEPYAPRIVGELNGQELKVARFDGPFPWHAHPDADEMFLVMRGRFRLCLRDREVVLEEGEFFIVPRGVEHRPVADEPCDVLLLEPAGTRNTGEQVNEFTREADRA